MYRPPALIVTAQGRGDLGHLHQRQNALLHAGAAAGAADEDQRQLQPRRLLGGPRQLLADHRAHAAGHEGEIGDAEDHRPAADVAAADDGGVRHARLGLLRLQALGVGQCGP